MPKYPKDAVQELVDEDEGITCKTCTTPLTESDDAQGDGYCLYCRSYWKDVSEGMFCEWEGL